MNKSKKLLSLLLAALLASSLLTACGGTTSSTTTNSISPTSKSDVTSEKATDSNEPLSIQYLTARNTDEAVIQSLVKISEMYKETHPDFKFEVESITDRTSYLQKVKILAASDELPEWFESDPDTFFADIVDEGLVYDIEALYDELGVADKFFNISKEYARLPDGRLNLITWQCNTEYFFYNKNLFNQAGITELPKTMNDLLAACEKLEGAGITPISMSNTWPIFRYFAFIPFRMTGNQYLENACAGKASWADGPGIDNAEYMIKLASYFQDGWTTSEYQTMVDLFTGGKVAMMYNGTWELPSVVDENKELKPEFGTFQMPAFGDSDATGPADYFANSGIGTAVLQEAMTPGMKDFLSFVFENYADVALNDFNLLPSIEPSDTSGLPEIYQQIITDAKGVKTYAKCWDVVIDSASLDTLNRETINMVLGEITPEQWAAALDEAVKQNTVK